MPFSLKYRIAIIIFVLEAIMLGVVLWQTLEHSEHATRGQLDDNDSVVLEVMSGVSRVALLTEEYADLQPYLENLLQNSRIEQVVVIDARNLVVASSDPDAVGKAPPDITATRAHAHDRPHQHFWRSREIRNGAGLLGTLAIEVSDDALNTAITDARNLGIGIAIAGMLIIAIVGLVAGMLLTRRLATVTAAANRFAQGELNARTGVGGPDEVGELGTTFDKMADNLQKTREAAETLIEELSSKNAQLERFTYTVSHDLKTPLVTVRGFAGMLEKDLAEGNIDGVKQDLQHILAGTDTMAKLLEDLLKLSQVGQVIDHMESVNLNGLFEEACSSLHSLISETGAQISIQPDMPEVYADRLRMYEVAINLLQNALKFSSADVPIRIEISAGRTSDTVECCVADNGIGIDPEYQEQIFGLFNRLDPSYEGTGIGLSLVKSIVEAHQGSVRVESQGRQAGSKFYFTLPLKLPDTNPEKAA
ncbi:MAG: ATP-binding protein [Gammaproteobacteria bacterium]|nr:ATP-binding protein [Gammaproteobacteria bacterium]